MKTQNKKKKGTHIHTHTHDGALRAQYDEKVLDTDALG